MRPLVVLQRTLDVSTSLEFPDGMRSSFYRVVLEDSASRQWEFVYRLLDLPVVEQFRTVTRRAIQAGGAPSGTHFLRPSTPEQVRHILNEMQALIAQINDIGIVDMPCEPITLESVNQAILNQLHRLFHAFEECCSEPKIQTFPALLAAQSRDPAGFRRTRSHLNSLNILIHQAEHGLKSMNDLGWQFFGFHFSEQERVQLQQEDYALMTAQVKAGDLLLCYGTAGKSLYTCFLDDDMAVVEHGEVRQQTTVSSGVLAAFPSAAAAADGPRHEREQYQHYLAWCRRNSVERYGHDYLSPSFRFGNIKLGQMDNAPTWDEMAAIIEAQPRVVTVQIDDCIWNEGHLAQWQ